MDLVVAGEIIKVKTLKDSTENRLGFYSNTTNTITIVLNTHERGVDSLTDTLIHELIHAISHNLRLWILFVGGDPDQLVIDEFYAEHCGTCISKNLKAIEHISKDLEKQLTDYNEKQKLKKIKKGVKNG